MSRLLPNGAWENRVIDGAELALAAGLPLVPLRELLRATRYAANAGRPSGTCHQLVCLIPWPQRM
jgi:hypothetical protein